MTTKKGIALFDLDGTITSKDTFLEFLKYTHGLLYFYLCMIINTPFIILYFLKIYPNHKLKERYFSFFYKNTGVNELKEKGDFFAHAILPKICYPDAIKILNWHKENGHDIYILTASSNIWLEKWCNKNNFNLIATEFEVIDGFYTGKIKGKNCYGLEKSIRIKNILNINDYLESYGYGDSPSDKHFLSIVKNPYLMSLTEKNIIKYWNKNIH